ncbi:hypothetical protein [Bradyrhizobium liaoningense]|uniref:hypothetical protein n=1 Tax=Bradyrhizobium liaoningense TaxID=43992 RepID=UPI001BA606C4|nr:hypothetical protein [Bradyrhizobium liaoningense]MBR1170242.1 hypothetical protein [Bradyrhizobium liaoningense]
MTNGNRSISSGGLTSMPSLSVAAHSVRGVADSSFLVMKTGLWVTRNGQLVRHIQTDRVVPRQGVREVSFEAIEPSLGAAARIGDGGHDGVPAMPKPLDDIAKEALAVAQA